MKISLVILTCNRKDSIASLLESINEQVRFPDELIVVDNASTDGSSDWISSHYPEIKLIRNNKNYGYAGGCNKGAEASSGEYLTFLNNDTVQNEDFIETKVILKSDESLEEVVVSGTLRNVSKLNSIVPIELYKAGFFKANPT